MDDNYEIRAPYLSFSEYFFHHYPEAEMYLTPVYHAILARLKEFCIRKINQNCFFKKSKDS
jgi:hypothetical protein